MWVTIEMQMLHQHKHKCKWVFDSDFFKPDPCTQLRRLLLDESL